MEIDREYQRMILERLKKEAPLYKGIDEFVDRLINEDDEKYAGTMLYLEEHGLVVGGIQITSSRNICYSSPRITAKGIDFIERDGGLSAILGAVTIKFHEESLRALLQLKVSQSDNLSHEDKSRWTAALQTLPGDAIKHLTMTLLDKGLEYLPEALQLIDTGIFC